MTTTYYSVTTDAFSTFLNDFIISGSTTLDLTGWSVKLGTGNLQPTHETTDLINVIYDKDTTGYLGFTASVYASGGQLISIPIPNSVLEGNIITEIGLYDSNDVLMCAAATYLDLTRTSAQGLQPNFIEQLVLKDIPSGVTVVYETWDDYQLRREKNQANGYAGLNENGKLPLSKLSSTNLSAFTDDLGSSPVHTHSQYLNNSQITNCIIETPNNLIWEDITNGVRLKAGSVVTFPDGFKDDNTTRKFKKVTTTQDIDITYTGSSTGNGLICLKSDLLNAYIMLLQNTSCGTTTPTNSNFWYDTTNNSIKRYNSSGILQNEDMSFPLGIFNFGTKKLIQSFDCYGFIGTGVFILDGIKYLIADGRNNDGSLKNKVVVTSTQMINCSSGSGYANNRHVSTMTTADILSYVYAGRLYFARTIDELPTITENSRNIAFVEKTNKWYHIYISGGVNEWTETTYYAIPMCDFKYSSTGLYLESCSTPRVEKLVKSSDADGQWVNKSLTLAENVAVPTGSNYVTLDLSSYLPNDGFNYEVFITGYVRTDGAVKQYCHITISTDLLAKTFVCQGYTTSASYQARAAGTAIVPVGIQRYIRIVSDDLSGATNTGSIVIRARGYRRIGANS